MHRRELLGNVIRRVFAALTPEEWSRADGGAWGLCQRIEEAVEELDEVIQVIRDAGFNLPYPMS